MFEKKSKKKSKKAGKGMHAKKEAKMAPYGVATDMKQSSNC